MVTFDRRRWLAPAGRRVSGGYPLAAGRDLDLDPSRDLGQQVSAGAGG